MISTTYLWNFFSFLHGLRLKQVETSETLLCRGAPRCCGFDRASWKLAGPWTMAAGPHLRIMIVPSSPTWRMGSTLPQRLARLADWPVLVRPISKPRPWRPWPSSPWDCWDTPGAFRTLPVSCGPSWWIPAPRPTFSRRERWRSCQGPQVSSESCRHVAVTQVSVAKCVSTETRRQPSTWLRMWKRWQQWGWRCTQWWPRQYQGQHKKRTSEAAEPLGRATRPSHSVPKHPKSLVSLVVK